jgi:hypothetical protein
MKTKDLWTDSDFEAMGWHDCRFYAVTLPDEQFQMKLDIDYIFALDESMSEDLKFWVSPCDLIFENISQFKINVDFEDSMLLFIGDIKRTNPRLSPNKKVTIWDYFINCDNGSVSFSATGFKQILRAAPVLSKTQDLNRKMKTVDTH